MKSTIVRKVTTALLPLFFVALLTACTDPRAAVPESVYQVEPWPAGKNVKTQKDVASYIVKGKTVYDACVVNLQAVRDMR